MNEETNMAIHDFVRMADAKSFALMLMDERVQFTFTAEPLCISYPIRALTPKQPEQVPTAG